MAKLVKPLNTNDVAGQVEIPVGGELLDTRGHPRITGWSRRLPVIYNRQRAAVPAKELREWEFYAIANPHCVVNLTLADVGIFSFCAVEALDLETGHKRHALTWCRRHGGDVSFPPHWEGGACFRRRHHTPMSFRRTSGKHEVALNFRRSLLRPAVSGNLTLTPDPPDSNLLACITPFPDDPRRFFYEAKHPGLRPAGWLQLGSQRLEFDPDRDWAVLDWGRGAWPHRVHWQWAAAAGTINNRRVALNLGSVGGDEAAATQNIAIVDGSAHKLATVDWTIPRRWSKDPWCWKDRVGRLKLTMSPRRPDRTRLHLIVGSIRVRKMYGRLHGTIGLDDGRYLMIDGLDAFAEDVHIRW